MSTELLKVSEVEKILGLSRTVVYGLAAKGILRKAYIGKGTRNFRITAESVAAYSGNLSQDPVEVSS